MAARRRDLRPGGRLVLARAVRYRGSRSPSVYNLARHWRSVIMINQICSLLLISLISLHFFHPIWTWLIQCICSGLSGAHYKHEWRFIQVNNCQYCSEGKANLMSPSSPDTSQSSWESSFPNSQMAIPQPVIERGRRLMTLCLPSKRLFDNRTPDPCSTFPPP